MAEEDKKQKLTGVMCPKCHKVIFGRDEDGCTVALGDREEKEMRTGRFTCWTPGCGQKIELQGKGGYKKSAWVPVDEFTER